MNAITQFLLASAALGALATAPAIAADAPHFHLTALHAGHAVNKTKVRDLSRFDTPYTFHTTYTLSIATYVPASDFGVKTKLPNTYYTWQCCTGSCGDTNPKQKIKGQKKSTYGKIAHDRESRSFGCQYDPIVFYGDDYTLTSATGEGKTDNFVSTLIGRMRWRGGCCETTGKEKAPIRYKGTLNLDVSVAIGE